MRLTGWLRSSCWSVFGEKVRQAFQFAESGNADAAVVASTLAKDRGGGAGGEGCDAACEGRIEGDSSEDAEEDAERGVQRTD
jgi:hypothetical protein